MTYSLEFICEASRSEALRVLHSVDVETEDWRTMVRRARIILSTRGYGPRIDAFQIIGDDKQVIYREPRGVADDW